MPSFSISKESGKFLIMHTAYLALGGNLGDVDSTFRRALKLISERIGQLSAISSTYSTRALLDPTRPNEPQPDYRNMVVSCASPLEPMQILMTCLEIETMLGRTREPGKRWQPRAIDIDVLLIDDLVISSPPLSIPHPEMLKRDFVLVPLCEIAPDLIHPVNRVTIRDSLEIYLNSGAERFVR